MDIDLRLLIKLLKVNSGLSYKAIAQKLNISESSIYNWLNNQFDFSSETNKKIIKLIEQERINNND